MLERFQPLARTALAWVALSIGPLRASAQDGAQELAQDQPPVVHPWQHVGDSLEGIYGWPNVLVHAAAAASTPPLALWVDEPVQEYFQRRNPLGGEAFGTAMLVGGGFTPVVIPGVLYLGGLAAEDNELATAGAAAVQAVIVETIVVTTLKWMTDRAGPFPDGDPNQMRWNSSVLHDSKSARDFNFNPFDIAGGLRWPSGHTASNMALVSSLVAFYPDELWLPIVGYPAALAIGVGTIEGDYHWLSDVVAGALIGHVIGWVVGNEFRAAFDARRAGTHAAQAHAARPRVRIMSAPLGVRVSGLF